MIYISDCLAGIVKVIEAPAEKLKRRVYNINALDFTPLELETEIGRQLKSPIKVNFESDFRQMIADSWPASLDDKNARKDWGWKPKINTIQKLVSEMLGNLKPNPGTKKR
jgi:threonine 3-dehydrogenase